MDGAWASFYWRPRQEVDDVAATVVCQEHVQSSCNVEVVLALAHDVLAHASIFHEERMLELNLPLLLLPGDGSVHLLL